MRIRQSANRFYRHDPCNRTGMPEEIPACAGRALRPQPPPGAPPEPRHRHALRYSISLRRAPTARRNRCPSTARNEAIDETPPCHYPTETIKFNVQDQWAVRKLASRPARLLRLHCIRLFWHHCVLVRISYSYSASRYSYSTSALHAGESSRATSRHTINRETPSSRSTVIEDGSRHRYSLRVRVRVPAGA